MTTPDTPQVIWARWFCREIIEAFRHIGKVEIKVASPVTLERESA